MKPSEPQPANMWGAILYILGHPQTFTFVFAAGVLYMLYMTMQQHAQIVANQANVLKNQEALVRLEDRQLTLMIKLLPVQKGR